MLAIQWFLDFAMQRVARRVPKVPTNISMAPRGLGMFDRKQPIVSPITFLGSKKTNQFNSSEKRN